MKMTKFSIIGALAVAALISGVTPSNAQDSTNGAKAARRPRGPSAEQMLERMTKDLNLTDEQKPKVKAVLDEREKQMREMRDLSGPERRDKMRTFGEEQDKKMKEILNPDQYEKWKKMRDEMRRNRGGAGNASKEGADKKNGTDNK